MNDDHKHSGQFDASMPLPDEVNIRHNNDKPEKIVKPDNPAAELVRQKVQAAYANAPPAADEVKEVSGLSKSAHQSRHQKFIDELIASGKSLPEIQTAWHEYYAGLPDKDKHQVWQEFYADHAQKSHFPGAAKAAEEEKTHKAAETPHSVRKRQLAKKATELRQKVAPSASRGHKRPATSPWHSLLFGLGIGSLVIIVFLFSFFNERFIAPFIQPSRSSTNTPIISDATAVGDNSEIIIPKINVEIPVVYDVTTINQNDVEDALEDGVVHYADTALPGQDGNVVIVGHSSNNIFNQGKYKFAFVLLSRLDNGDIFYLQRDGVRYTYEVYQKKIVDPNDVSVLGPSSKPATASLITCDPPGTSINRLVVTGEQISPSPSTNAAESTTNTLATKSAIIPGNSPTLWSRIVKWFKS